MQVLLHPDTVGAVVQQMTIFFGMKDKHLEPWRVILFLLFLSNYFEMYICDDS